jgi:gas vesicle protein
MYDDMHDDDHQAATDEQETSTHAALEDRSTGMRSLGLGLLLGAVLGAGAALLMAPQSGERTRRQLRRGARRLYREGGDAVADWWEEADRTARDLSRDGLRQGRKVATRFRDRVRERVRDGVRS